MAALLVLGLLGDHQDVAALVDALGDDDVAERADLALRLFGSTAVEPLLAVGPQGEAGTFMPPRSRW